LFGDIVKVTPSSKVVGDMALMMVSQGLSSDDVLDPKHEMAFPASVVEMLRGDLGQPLGGWPKPLQAKVLKDAKPTTERPGAHMPAADLTQAETDAQAKIGRPLEGDELLSYLMYPKVFTDYAALQNRYGPVSVLPTPVFFYGMKPGEEIAVELERGKTLVVRLQTMGETDEEGKVRVFFELNGQPRIVKVPNRSAKATVDVRRKAEEGNDTHVAAPMPGAVSTVSVKKGEAVKAGDVLLTIEAMKMETALHAPRDGTVTELLVTPGAQIDAKDLLVVLS